MEHPESLGLKTADSLPEPDLDTHVSRRETEKDRLFIEKFILNTRKQLMKLMRKHGDSEAQLIRYVNVVCEVTKRFYAHALLRKAALSWSPHTFGCSQLLRKAALSWDGNASGGLDAQELIGVMHQLGVRLTTQQARRVITIHIHNVYMIGAIIYVTKSRAHVTGESLPTLTMKDVRMASSLIRHW